MAWAAKVTAITPVITSFQKTGEPSVQYRISVDFYLQADPATVYTRHKVVPYTVTGLQVLAFIKSELSDLNAGDTLPTTLAGHIDEEITETTTW